MNDEDHDGHTINLGPPAGSPADERPKWDPREKDDWYPPHAPSTPVDEAERAVWQCGRTDPHNPHASYADAAKVCPGIPGESMAKLNRSEDWTAGAIPINEERHDQLLCCRCCGNRIGITGIGTGICDRDGCDLSMMEQAGARRWGPKAPPAPPVSPPVPERLPATVSCPDCRGSGMTSQQHDYATEILGCEGCQGEGVLHVADLIAALVRLHASSPVNASIVRNITEALAPLAAADRGEPTQ